MIKSPRNYLLPSNIKKCIILILLCPWFIQAQIANYVNNGGFELAMVGLSAPMPKYWNALDTGGTKFFGKLFTGSMPPFNVPYGGQTFQWPRHGNNFLASTFYCPSCASNARGYPRNNLKKVLTPGETYCFTMYLNLTNKSSYSIDRMGVYFADTTNDTIKYCSTPITYLTPQIQSPDSIFLSDTLNWMPFQGLYTANGNEKYIVIGNFRDNANTHNVFVNSIALPGVFADYCIDDVSLIDINLPAFAGRDTIVFPGSSVFLGREPDVGIDEACIWYKLPDMLNPIDTIAGFWINPTSTATYVVKQQLWCNNTPKWDTVVVETSIYVGLNKVRLSVVEGALELYPNPAQDFLELKTSNPNLFKEFNLISIYNSLGQLMREEEVVFENKTLILNTNDLENGIYFFTLKSTNLGAVRKRFIISR